MSVAQSPMTPAIFPSQTPALSIQTPNTPKPAGPKPYWFDPKPCLLKPQAVSTQIPNEPPISKAVSTQTSHIGSTPSRDYSNPQYML